MTVSVKSQNELMADNEELRLRLEEAEETLRAIGSGEVDAFVVTGPEGEQQVFTLKGAEQPYRILVESMNEGAATLAADGTILYCNKRLSVMLNCPLENLIGTKLGSYVDPKEYPTYAALVENCTQESMSEEFAMTTTAGSIPVYMSCCVNGISGSGGISVVVTDLTLQRRNAEILASEEFSTSIIEQSSEAMIVCDPTGKIIRASQTACALCGTNPLLKQFNKIFPLQFAESGKKFSLVQHMRAGNVTSSEVEFKRDDKQIVNLLLNATNLKSLQNRDIGSVITLTDITGRKTAEMALQLSEVRLQSAYSHLQVVNEELQIASEELHAQSEELRNQNQELQKLWERAKESEEIIRISEERHRVLAETMLQGVVHQDADGTIVSMNPSAERILGKSREHFLGSSSVEEEHDTIHENGEIFPGVEHPTMEVLRTGLPVRGVVMGVYNPKLKEYRWIGIDAVPVFRPGEDRPSEVYSVFEDITARKQAEMALAAANQKIQSIVDNSPAIVYAFDLEERFVLANAAIAKLFNSTPAQMIGKRRHDFMPQTDAYWHEANDRKVIEAGLALSFEEQSELPGRSITWLTTKFPLRDAENKIYAVGGISTDITERKQGEIALQESEQRMQQALQVSRSFTFDWLTVTDRVIRSASCAAILKLTGDEAVYDTGEHFIQCVHPDDRARFGQILRDLTPAADSYISEYRYVCKEGSEITLEETGHASFDSNGTLLRLVGVSTDITARKQAEEALRKIHAELESRIEERTADLAEAVKILEEEIHERKEAEKALYEETSERLKAVETLREKEQMLILQSRQAAMGEMIGNIAHQWRQPLTALGLYTQRVGMFYGTPNFTKEFLDNSISKSMEIIRHLSNTIDDFRDYFKPEREKSDFYLTEAIKTTLSLLEGNFRNPKITVDFIEHGNPVICGYQNEFAQVILNILNNARDAIIEREIADARVLITICNEVSCAVVTIADNAGGIPEEIIDKVFDPYFTTKGPQAGTGIGLFMSKAIIEKSMGGRLTVRNSASGAEFRIEVAHGTKN